MLKDAGISPFHMIRKFKKAFGLTPLQYQNSLSIKTIKLYLTM
ncbi:MAG: AraC family transcriptional regulator [Treponema sp.]|nr:AraC family transcriptional regulator [Treponema sp.]